MFEGRDGAGKGGVIKAITKRVSPRVFRVVALPAPTEREKSQMYIRRNISHLPAAGEIVMFDRSYYNRAGVERGLSLTSIRRVDLVVTELAVIAWSRHLRGTSDRSGRSRTRRVHQCPWNAVMRRGSHPYWTTIPPRGDRVGGVTNCFAALCGGLKQ